MSVDFIVLSCNRTQNCATDRQNSEGQTEGQKDRHTDEIIYVRFRRYVCISFANFLLCKKYIAQLNNWSSICSRSLCRIFLSTLTHGAQDLKGLNLVMCETHNMFGLGDNISPQGGWPGFISTDRYRAYIFMSGCLWRTAEVHRGLWPCNVHKATAPAN